MMSAARSDGCSSTSTAGSATRRSWHGSPGLRPGRPCGYDDHGHGCAGTTGGSPVAGPPRTGRDHGARRAVPAARDPGHPVRPWRGIQRPGQPDGCLPDAGRAAVRQVPARGADGRTRRAVPVAGDPGLRRRSGRGRRRQGPAGVRRQGGDLRRAGGHGGEDHDGQLVDGYVVGGRRVGRPAEPGCGVDAVRPARPAGGWSACSEWCSSPSPCTRRTSTSSKPSSWSASPRRERRPEGSKPSAGSATPPARWC